MNLINSHQNPQRKLIHRLTMLAAVSAMIAVSPFMLKLDFASIGSWVFYPGLLLCLFFSYHAVVRVGNGKKYELLLRGDERLAHWTFTDYEWLQYVKEEYTERLSRNKFELFLCLILFIITAVVSGVDTDSPSPAFGRYTYFIDYVVVSALIYGIPRFKYARDKKAPPEIFIGESSVLIGNKFFVFDRYGRRLEDASYENHPSRTLTIYYSTRRRMLFRTHASMSFPVPRSAAEHAQRIAGHFHGKAEELGIRN